LIVINQKNSRGYERYNGLEDRKLVRDEKMRVLFRIELRQSKLGTDLAFTNKEKRKTDCERTDDKSVRE